MKQILALLFIAFLSTTAYATPVGPMNYQGRLLDDAGIPVTGSYNFVIRIYNDPAAGTLRYQETHNSVPVDDGVYAFKIGSGSQTGGDSLWDINLWQGNLNDLYLEVMVNGETLTPRHELTSAPHAFTSTFALSANALGNKTAAEYDNILEGVCVASKGKWLDSINKCLGSGAVITNQVITASDGLDYSNLELVDVDLSGTSFPSGANFTGSIFRDSILSFAGFSNTNLIGTHFENITVTTPLTASDNLYQAFFKNMSMSGFTLGSVSLNGASIAELSTCPASLPAGYGCREQFTGSGRYFVYGPNMNFSSSSALATSTNQGTTLQLHEDVFDGAASLGHSLQGANFSGVIVPTHFRNEISINFANFSDAKLTRLEMPTYINNPVFERAILSQLKLNLVGTAQGNNLKGAHIAFTSLEGGGNFTGAELDHANLSFIGNTSTFHRTTIRDTSISTNIAGSTNLQFTNSLITGMFRINQGSALSYGSIYGVIFDNCDFVKMQIRSEILFDAAGYSKGVFFDGNTIIRNSRFRSVDILFNQADATVGDFTLENNEFNATVFSGNLKNTDFNGNTLAPSVSWLDGIAFQNGTVCPDNTTQNSGAATRTCGNSGVGQTNW